MEWNCRSRVRQAYQIPLSFPVKRYASKADTAKGGSRGRRNIARKSACLPALSNCAP